MTPDAVKNVIFFLKLTQEFGKPAIPVAQKLMRDNPHLTEEEIIEQIMANPAFKAPQRHKPDAVEILSGDGETIETPVKFAVLDVPKRIRAERNFIVEKYGSEGAEWEELSHYTVMQPKTYKMISQWVLRLASGETVSVYFDKNRD